MSVDTSVTRTRARKAGGPAPHLAGWSRRPEQQEVYEATRRFARSLAGDAIERDRDRRFSREDWDRCGAFGLQGLPAPQEHGGGGADVSTTMLALEAFGYGCQDAGLVFSVNAHLWTSVIPLWHHGSPEQQARWLPDLCSGRAIGCHAITEPDAGSDPFGMRARATRVEGGYLLDGTEDVHHERPGRRPVDRVRSPQRRRGSVRHLCVPRRGRHARMLDGSRGRQDGAPDLSDVRRRARAMLRAG